MDMIINVWNMRILAQFMRQLFIINMKCAKTSLGLQLIRCKSMLYTLVDMSFMAVSKSVSAMLNS